MQEQTLQDLGRAADHPPEQERPLGGYAVLTSTFLALTSGFSAWVHFSGRELPEEVNGRDLALIAVATHKASRLLAKDRVTSVVRAPFTRIESDGDAGKVTERARGGDLRRALGELVTCPHCLGLWIATGLTAGLVVSPRPTRWIASILSAVFVSDVLQIAYRRAESSR